MDFEKVAAAAFIDELTKIAEGLDDGAREKIASVFHEQVIGDLTVETVAAMIKEAGFFDRMKSFVGGGMQNGIPMHSLGSQLAQSSPFTGMGSSLASSARQAGSAIGNAASSLGGKLSAGAGAVGSFLRGGTNAQGIPMMGLGQQLRESNPMAGMFSSLRGAAPPPVAQASRSTPPPLPARARINPMEHALFQGMAGARTNPLATMNLGG